MNVTKVFSLLVLALVLTGCGGGPQYRDMGAPSGPTGFMNYSQNLGEETMNFNPCGKGGIKQDTRNFSANTTTNGSTDTGVHVGQTTHTSKVGQCHGEKKK